MAKKKKTPVKNSGLSVPEPGYLESLGVPERPPLPPTLPPSGELVSISIRLPSGLLERAKSFSSGVGISVNALLCVSLSEYLRDRLT